MSRPATTVTSLALTVGTIGIVLLSLGPDVFPDMGPGIVPGIVERLPHALAYAALTGLILVAWRPRQEARGTWLRITMVAIAILAIGVALEVGQSAVDREADPLDVLANAAGIGAAIGIWAATAPRRGRGSRDSDRSVPTSRERGVRTGNGSCHREGQVVK
jgi:VanZ family protein